MNLSKFGLLFVVFVDVAGQGLLYPIFSVLIADPTQGFLSPETSEAARRFSYGLVIGIFYLSWFLGAVYVSRLSDSIGRKNGILICLAGSIGGYVLTILALAFSSLWLLILGRAITGFTAGNQPIAQAAMADLSEDDAEKARNLGYVVAAFSIGLVAGPILAGVLSDAALIGDWASFSLPFYVAGALVVVAFVLVALFFEDKLESRVPLEIKPVEVFRLLWRVRHYPTVLRISGVFFFFMLVHNTYIIFLDDYLSVHFGIGTFGASAALLVFGATTGFSSAFLVSAFGARFSRQAIVIAATVTFALSAALFVSSGSTIVAYLVLVPYGVAFAVGYTTLLAIFSASVDSSQQGWVMGLSTALWSSGAGMTSLLSGDLTTLYIGAPFILAIGSAVLTLILIGTIWQTPAIQRIVGKQSEDAP